MAGRDAKDFHVYDLQDSDGCMTAEFCGARVLNSVHRQYNNTSMNLEHFKKNHSSYGRLIRK